MKQLPYGQDKKQLDNSLISNYFAEMKKDLAIFMASRISYKANKFLAGELKKNKIQGLAPSHGDILGALIMKGQLQMKELIEIIDKDKSTITALVKKLISLGYIEKSNDIDDRRISYIRLTKKGESLGPVVKQISGKLKSKAFRGITNEEKKILFGLLSRISDNFD